MTTTTTHTDWWRTTPNPPCEPWCTREHTSNEFASNAGLLCFHTVLDTDEARIDVQRTKHVSLDGASMQAEDVTIWLEVPHNSVLEAEQAYRLGTALQEAAEFVRAANA
jgi:hypothetical protein